MYGVVAAQLAGTTPPTAPASVTQSWDMLVGESVAILAATTRAGCPAMDEEITREPPGDVPNSPSQRARLQAVTRCGAVGHLAECVTVALEIRGAINLDALQVGVDQALRRRPALRSDFQATRDTHRIVDCAAASVRRVAASGESPAQRWASAHRLARDEAHQPFPVGTVPLLRATLFEAADRHLFLLTMDQLACDAWSANLIVADVVTAADLVARGLPPAAAGPDEYERARRVRSRWVDGEGGRSAVASRRTALAGHTLRWPLLGDPLPDQRGRLVEETVHLDAESAGPFLQRVRTTGGSVLSAAVLALALAADLGPADRVALTSTFACRQSGLEEGVVGWFSNEVAIPLPQLAGTVTDLMRSLRSRLGAALNDQAAPHELVARQRPEDYRDGSTVSLLYLPAQLTGSDQRSLPIGAASASRGRVTICPTGADVDLYLIEESNTAGGVGPAMLTLGAMSCRGEFTGAALKQLLARWQDSIRKLGSMDWRRDQVLPLVAAASRERA